MAELDDLDAIRRTRSSADCSLRLLEETGRAGRERMGRQEDVTANDAGCWGAWIEHEDLTGQCSAGTSCFLPGPHLQRVSCDVLAPCPACR